MGKFTIVFLNIPSHSRLAGEVVGNVGEVPVHARRHWWWRSWRRIVSYRWNIVLVPWHLLLGISPGSVYIVKILSRIRRRHSGESLELIFETSVKTNWFTAI